MKTTTRNVWMAGLATLLFASTSQAHHSFAAAYNLQGPIEIKGSIVDVRLTNPHSHFFIDVVNDKGETEHWKIGFIGFIIVERSCIHIDGPMTNR